MGERRKVVVLGGNGQLGVALKEHFGKSCDVAAFSHKDLDICDTAALDAAFARENPWAVINAAAWTDVDGCEGNVEKAYTVNALGAENVAAAAVKAGARVAYISTDYVFDGFKNSPYTEEDEPNPLSIYGKSKLEGEILTRKAAPEALIVRSSWLFGMGRSNFVMRLFELVMVKKEITVVTDRRGTPTYTADLAEALNTLLDKGASGLFHVSNAGECSWYEYAVEILKVLGVTECTIKPVTSDTFVRPAPRPAYTVMDNGKYRGVAGKSLRPWKEALASFLSNLNTEMSPSDIL